VPALDPGGDYLRRAWQNSVLPLAERLGVVMRLPPLQPRSRRAHEAAKWAGAAGRFDEYNQAVFRAFFEDGEDIGDPEVLVRLATDLGMDGEGLRAALDSRQHEAAVLADEREAERLELGGVPAFVANRRAVLSGVQPLENLRALIRYVQSPRASG
jgi:predicted DsbA family dithiol-disulfide isomerase